MTLSVVIDFIILVLVSLPILILYLVADPYQRGFFCNDESISHPYRDDTVTMTLLVSLGICIPVVTILIVELVRGKLSIDEDRQIKIFNWNAPVCLQNMCKYIGFFLFGAACCQLTTDTAKLSIGRLRPHFIRLCNPQFSDNLDCSSPTKQHQYIEDFTCNNAEATDKMLREMRLSFPSGHSSFAFFTMVFCALYLQSRFTWRGPKLLKHGLQFLLVILAVYTSLSRISDYKHHWSDVLVGAILGIVIALLVGFGIPGFFKKELRDKLPLSHAR